MEASGIPFDYDMVVVDELSSFKNHQSKRFRAMMKVRPKVGRIVGLTGTPSSNGLMDLWAEFKLLDMGQRLGRFIGQYRTRFFLPGQAQWAGGVFLQAPSRGGGTDLPADLRHHDFHEIHRLPAYATVRFPPAMKVYLSEEETQRYVSFKRDLLLQLPDGGNHRRQCCGSFREGSPRWRMVRYTQMKERLSPSMTGNWMPWRDIIESMGGKPLLVAYWFRHDLERITGRLHKLKIHFPGWIPRKASADGTPGSCRWR